jgi:hypothetical protein
MNVLKYRLVAIGLGKSIEVQWEFAKLRTWGAWWPPSHMQDNVKTMYDNLTICFSNARF